MPLLKNISIILKPRNDSDFELILPNLVNWLYRRKKNISFLEKESSRLNLLLGFGTKNISYYETEVDLHEGSDLIITLGGDGTLIGACRNFKKKSPPIFGVNLGNLGFITEFSKAEFFDELENALKGDFLLTHLPLYKVEIFNKEKVSFVGHFLNDVVINNNNISRMLTLTVDCDNDHVYDLSGDGLIISSPIGSTAYSLAAGGPIIHPSVHAMTLTPICAHSLAHRPLVVTNTSLITVRSVRNEDSIKITLDGQQVLVMGSHDTVRVTRSKNKIAKLIKNPNRSYFATLKEKFTHGAREIK